MIARFSGQVRGDSSASLESIVVMLRRRPCTADNVAHSFSLPVEESERILAALLRDQRVRIESRAGREYYRGA